MPVGFGVIGVALFSPKRRISGLARDPGHGDRPRREQLLKNGLALTVVKGDTTVVDIGRRSSFRPSSQARRSTGANERNQSIEIGRNPVGDRGKETG
jgi:hypothetical protein